MTLTPDQIGNLSYQQAQLEVGGLMDDRFSDPLKSFIGSESSVSDTPGSSDSGTRITLKGISDAEGNQTYDPGTFKGTMAFGLYNQVTDTLGNNWNQLTDKHKQAITATRRVTGGG